MNKTPVERAKRVAVIGMACRMPGASNYEEFWNNLRNERCSIGEVPPERWSKERYYSADPDEVNKTISKWGGFIDGADQFDPNFFGISPREAQFMDPQQRIILELAWSCFEDAGYLQSKISGSRTGVYIGMSQPDYQAILQESGQPFSAYWATGIPYSIISNRISYVFNLNGPSMSIDTACSGSLLALHQAIQSLRNGETMMALVGGCSILSGPSHFVSFSKMGMLSPDGLCKTFDEKANGYVRGEGCAVVLLKLEEQALADGDRILGVISGSASNHGGHARTLTSPNAYAQARVIVEAHQQAGVSPDSISYIEAHGTGTPKGDPIEVAGLKRAFAKLAEHSSVSLKEKACAIGAVKTNIGHLEPVAGLAGLIKVLLCLQHKTLPKLLHFEKLNPRIDLDGSPFYMLDRTQEWLPAKTDDGEFYPRRAGVSSFGFGGANAHIVVEEAPSPGVPRQGIELPAYLICLSAKTEEALRQRQRQLAEWLEKKGKDAEILDVSATLLLGRQHWEFRSAFVAKNINEVREKLDQLIAAECPVDGYCGNSSNKGDQSKASTESTTPTFIEKLRHETSVEASEYHGGLTSLAEMFANGGNADWEVIFAGTDARRIALPTYPFAKKIFPLWSTQKDTAPAASQATAGTDHRQEATVKRRISLQPLPDRPIAVTAPALAIPQVLAISQTAEPAVPVESEPTPEKDMQASPPEDTRISVEALRQQMRTSLAAALYLGVDEVGIARPFVEQGLDSVVGVEWMRTLNSSLGLNIPVTKLYDYPTILLLADYLHSELGKRVEQAPNAPAVRAAEVTGRQLRISLRVTEPVASSPTPEAAKQPSSISEQALQMELRQSLAASLYMEEETIDPNRPFVELGLDSVVGVEWIRAINMRYGLSMPATKLYDYATITALAQHVKQELEAQGRQAHGQPPLDTASRADNVAPPTTDASPAPFVAKPAADNYGLALTTVQVLDEVSLTDWTVAAPADGEVTVRVYASALNFPDVMCVQGLYPTMPDYPFVPGFEVAGVISAVGRGVPGYNVGDEVIAVTGRKLGGHASHVNVPLANVIRKPKGMRYEEACSIPVIFSTVHHAFQVAKLGRSEHVLVQTATGGCGLAALQMARLQDCVCYGTSSQPEKLDLLRRLGVEYAINYKTTAFDDEILKISNGRGVDVVLNMLSGDAIQRGLNCLAPFGRYLEIAVHALRTSQKLDLSKLVHNQSVHSIDLRRMTLENGASWSESFEPLLPLFESRQLFPVVSRIYPVGQIVDAMRYVTQGRHIGKVVISHTMTEMVDCTEQCIERMLEQHRNAKVLAGTQVKAPVVPATVRHTVHPPAPVREDIAVIGMSGQFPQAKNLEEFWRNLRDGKDCVAEVPTSRWPVEKYFDASGKIAEKTYCKWMGALADVDQFDPLFFNIAPAEARLMDPEQRLFLQNVWHCLEDAGIRPASLAGSRCGVFVGCASGDYGTLLGADRLSAHGLMGGAASILAGRVSYFFNLQGPCISIDTACSSSLVAVAEACESLVAGTSDLALAGGAYVMTTPSMHIMTSQAGMLSRSGRCQTFDQNADGFVPSEGVGVVLLKRLSDAQRDGDRIYGVVRGWGIKQDGKTNGITAPSVNSQIALEKEIYERFSINPDHISLIEAHGTGTKLGDPIEVEALTQSFRAYTDRKQYCALGSVKSNIGHGLTAAGIGGFIKVMLCMAHKKLVPSINFRTANEHINFADSPFFVNTEYRDWEPGHGQTRLAAMSSFGFSGTNVHLVMEDYAVSARASSLAAPANDDVLIVLSARNPDQLKAHAKNLHAHLEAHPEFSLEDVAYTLQVGREPMEYRLGFVASSREILLDNLLRYAAGETPSGLHVSQSGGGKLAAYFSADGDAQELLRTWMRKRNLEKLAELWAQGVNPEWRHLHEGRHPLRVGLPGYPFAQERYWATSATAIPTIAALVHHAAQLHPLLHANASILGEQRFQSHFTGSEFFFVDHKVRNKKVLPGVAHLEMALAAVMRSMNDLENSAKAVSLCEVAWSSPAVLERESLEVGITLEPEEDGRIGYRIYRQASPGAGRKQVYSTGIVRLIERPDQDRVDLARLRAECSLDVLDAADCYAAFQAVQLDYGPGHRGLERVYRGNGKALAKLRLPNGLLATMDDYVLHPSLLDSALQACIGLLADSQGRLDGLALPYGLQELQILGPCSISMWAFVRYASGDGAQPGSKMDVDLCDDNGRVCVRMRGFALRGATGNDKAADASIAQTGIALAVPTWKSREIARDDAAPAIQYTARIAVFCEMDDLDSERIRSRLEGVHCLFLDERGADIGIRFREYAERVLAEIQRIFRQPSTGPLLMQVVHATQGEQQLLGALASMLRAAQAENPLFFGQVIGFEPGTGADVVAKRLQEESQTDDQKISYRDNRRHIAVWRAAEDAAWIPMPWKAQGVYLVTGGAGGLGFIFAEEIVRKCPASSVIMTGRSALSAGQQTRLAALRANGNVEYRQADVADKQTVATLIAGLQRDYGRLDGIIHSAGVVRDSFIRHKDLTEVAAVLAPKVQGVMNLDEASRSMALDFFAIFSSMAGVIGNVGQADYAAANAFVDAFAAYRDQLVVQGKRYGKTLSINWPLWKDGGMQVDQVSEERIRRKIGVVDAEEGRQAFYRAMTQACSQVAVTAAAPDELDAIRKKNAMGSRVEQGRGAVEGADTDGVIRFVTDILVKVLKIPANKLDVTTSFEKFGIDSIVQATLIQEMERVLGELPRTLLFEHANIRELATFLAQNYPAHLFVAGSGTDADKVQDGEAAKEAAMIKAGDRDLAAVPHAIGVLRSHDSDITESADIAIIGIGGRYPQSATMEKLWENLSNGRNCVTRAPADRWVASLNATIRTAGKECFGGFLDEVDRFDHHLFDVPSEDALRMTPELRMFLEVVWETFEDAGYSKSRLQALQDSRSCGVGVFVGSMYSQYGWTMPSLDDAVMSSNETDWQIANRVSHFFDLRGPSIAVNTACSSSMTAIHLACESLRQGSCSMAIAGGVNLTLDRSKYDRLREFKILDEGSQSKSFGAGEGYVPGEGVGAVLLKPLAQAIRDNDRIEAVIKSSFVNHSGGRQKYTVPDPKRQAELIANSIRRAKVDAETITYVESAANGSPLGDPVEVVALANAFGKFTGKKRFCALGSVKSNLGHLEAASGISQLSKALLQLKHKTLVPSIHAAPTNPAIKLDNSAFYLQQETAPWQAPTDSASGEALPRRCMINSFGAGGSYANLILEEYVPVQGQDDTTSSSRAGRQLCVFSAMTENSLTRYLEVFYDYVKENANVSLEDVASSLRKINNDLPYRAAVAAVSRDDLLAKLGAMIDGYGMAAAGVYSAASVAVAGNAAGTDGLHLAAVRWVAGRQTSLDGVDYRDDRPCLSLPKYRFEHDTAFRFAQHASAEDKASTRGSSDFYQAIFEKIAQGVLSEEQAWELVQNN